MLNYYVNEQNVVFKDFFMEIADNIMMDLPDYSQQKDDYARKLNSKLLKINVDYVKRITRELITNYAQNAINGFSEEFYIDDIKFRIEFMFDCNGLEQLEELRKELGC